MPLAFSTATTTTTTAAVLGLPMVWWLLLRRPRLSEWAPPIVGHNVSFLRDPHAFFGRMKAKFGNRFTIDVFLQTTTFFLGEQATKDVYRNDGKAVVNCWPYALRKLLGRKNLTVVTDPRLHRKLRKKFAPTPNVPLMASIVRGHVDAWIAAEAPMMENFVAKTHALAFDIARATLLGSRTPTIDLMAKVQIWLGGFVAFLPIDLPWLRFGKAMAARRDLSVYFGRVLDEGPCGEACVVDALLLDDDDDDDTDGDRLSREEFIDNMILLIFAAYDTAAYTIATMLYLLAEAPGGREAVAAVRAELDATWDGAPESFPKLLLSKENDNTPILDAVTKEALRLGNPIIAVYRKATATLQVDGHAIKAGQNVGLAPLASLRDPVAFPEPGTFNYERFLANNGAPPADKAKPNSYIPFGGGTRLCLGRQVAMAELKLVLATVVKHADFHVLDVKRAGYPLFVGFNPSIHVTKRQKKNTPVASE